MSSSQEQSARACQQKFAVQKEAVKSKTQSSDGKKELNNSTDTSTPVPEKLKDFVESTW